MMVSVKTIKASMTEWQWIMNWDWRGRKRSHLPRTIQNSVRIVGILKEIQTGHLPNINQKRMTDFCVLTWKLAYMVPGLKIITDITFVVTSYQATRYHNPESQNNNFHRRVNLKSHIAITNISKNTYGRMESVTLINCKLRITCSKQSRPTSKYINCVFSFAS
jgi:hypothetical protein